MDTNRMELSMDELAMVNGGRDLSEKIMGVVKCAECGAATGAIAGGGIGSVVPVIGTGSALLSEQRSVVLPAASVQPSSCSSWTTEPSDAVSVIHHAEGTGTGAAAAVSVSAC